MNTTEIYTTDMTTYIVSAYGNDTFNNLTTAGSPVANPPGRSPLEDKLLEIQSVMNIILLIIILISVGASTNLKAIVKYLKTPIGIVVATCIEFILMPAVGYGLGRLVKLPATYHLGLYIVSCSPGGALSNLFTLASRGCVPLSITMTTTATILSVGVLPLHLFLYSKLTSATGAAGGTIAIPFQNVLITLACIIFPASLGIFVRYKSERIAIKMSRICGLIGFLLILVALGIRIYLNVELYLTASWEPLFVAGIVPLIGMTVAFILTTLFRMPCNERRTVSLETGGQNFTLALTVISLSFPPSRALREMLVMPSFYAFFSTIEVICLVFITQIYSRYQICGSCEKVVNDSNKVDSFEEGVTNYGMEINDNMMTEKSKAQSTQTVEEVKDKMSAT